MLFLAVFCGFLAENQREHMVEHGREKQYIRSLKEDLENDIDQLRNNETRYEEITARLDSMADGFNPRFYTQPPMRAYWQLLRPFGFPDFIYTDRTMQQLKNAGGMRLIRKRGVADSIAAYDAVVRRGTVHQDLINNIYMPKINDKSLFLFDQAEMSRLAKTGLNAIDTITFKKNVLLSNDPIDRVRFVNELKAYRENIREQSLFIMDDRIAAQHLLALLKKAYDLE